ncbi:DUF1835 domain-containing protein [Aquimarina sp. 2201CG5-10]|uniref:DUF1835 domain-containing protein n=1 Tax=Aquimarina callyspongiae TaxID=3098150 RepID=UPI002AB442B0|nr:DUF1835 domain-containing protein [Aquimarina sp. 2201CG5-10]MDY8135388.1 DUF1835 domain-containing protein [Aquimarina sp. 2201CG5-10]
MRKQIHILNGDSLKQQFPESIQGDIIVARECLVDGNVKGKDLNELFTTRAKFITQNYGGTEQGYYEKAASEFLKIPEINNNSDINLWFEDDLFCQVHFWFIVHLLMKNNNENNQVFLIRPKIHTQYGFGGLNKSKLISIYKNRLELSELEKIADLWEFYQNDDIKKLTNTALELEKKYPFILPAVKAHIQRIPSNENLGRPTESLITIMKELKTEEFGTVFREFNQREYIYGFGDLQVKRLYDQIINNH